MDWIERNIWWLVVVLCLVYSVVIWRVVHSWREVNREVREGNEKNRDSSQ
jgi:hypothetical protein